MKRRSDLVQHVARAYGGACLGWHAPGLARAWTGVTSLYGCITSHLISTSFSSPFVLFLNLAEREVLEACLRSLGDASPAGRRLLERVVLLWALHRVQARLGTWLGIRPF